MRNKVTWFVLISGWGTRKEGGWLWGIVCPYNKYLLRQILADLARAEFKQDYVLRSDPALSDHKSTEDVG